MDHTIKKRLNWVGLYLETNDAGFVCRRCGISRPTLRKWVTRVQNHGIEGLNDKSRKPENSPCLKITTELELLILSIRKERNLGVRRLQTELLRLHDCHLALATIHKVFRRNNAPPLVRLKRKQK